VIASAHFGKRLTRRLSSRKSLQHILAFSHTRKAFAAVDDSFVVPILTTMKAVGFSFPAAMPQLRPRCEQISRSGIGNAPNAWNGVAVGADGRPGLMLSAPDEQAAIEGV
jgi:hypothetical protein